MECIGSQVVEAPTGEHIRALREIMGWSQVDVARLLHMSGPTMISRYENSTYRMHRAHWELLCIKASDQRFKTVERHKEIVRHINSRAFVSGLLRRVAGLEDNDK